MTAFTELSEALLAEELADTIERFNATTADVIAQRSGRVVKTIGDEVMFTTSDPVRGAEVAVALLDAVSLDTRTPELSGLHDLDLLRHRDVCAAMLSLLDPTRRPTPEVAAQSPVS
jgi:class 3 adenylate cyclase